MKCRTKIIVTLGPATEDYETIRQLIERGVSVFRLNMSHARFDWVKATVPAIRDAACNLGREVAVLMDLQGPAIRTGELAEPVMVTQGMVVEFLINDVPPAQAISTTVNYPGLAHDVKAGDLMLVDNGVIHMRVLAVTTDRVTCEVITDGKLGSRRHINLPGIKINLPALTEKDMACLDLAAETGVDFVALSFAREAAHMLELSRLLQEKGSHARVVAKIEDQEAISQIDSIIEASDTVMIARGDLGIEVHLEELPALQRHIIRRCAYFGRKVIVATHLLESMVHNPVPTRAEVTDIANAVYEQADALMLSAETSVGEYPLRCVELLDRVARRIEREKPQEDLRKGAFRPTQEHQAVLAAVELSDRLEQSRLVIFTKGGMRGHLVALERPESPVFVFSPRLDVVRVLQMARGVTAFVMEFGQTPEATVEAGLDMLKSKGLIVEGDQLVILTDATEGGQRVDSILLRQG
jgi:pyruvate kinase